jgi:hypothetical protein
MMAINWQDVITTVGSGSALLAAAAWLIKTVLNNRLARDADVFKTQLKADADKEIERLKTSLQMVAVEHQVRFSKLHEKHAEVIAELYKRLVDVYWRGRTLIINSESNGTPGQREEFTNLQKEMGELFMFIERHRIYLPDSICTMLDNFAGYVRGNVRAVGIFGHFEHPSEEILQLRHDAFLQAYDEFESDIPAARRALEIEFRKMLGVEEDTGHERRE